MPKINHDSRGLTNGCATAVCYIKLYKNSHISLALHEGPGRK